MANDFLSFYEIKWLEQCQKEFKQKIVFTIFVLFQSAEDHSKSPNYFYTYHPNMSFPFEERKKKFSILVQKYLRKKGRFVTTVYTKPTFSGVYTYFESFLPAIYKFGMVYTLAS